MHIFGIFLRLDKLHTQRVEAILEKSRLPTSLLPRPGKRRALARKSSAGPERSEGGGKSPPFLLSAASPIFCRSQFQIVAVIFAYRLPYLGNRLMASLGKRRAKWKSNPTETGQRLQVKRRNLQNLESGMAEYSNFPKPAELNFHSGNLVENWRKWKQSMKFYLDAIPGTVTKKQKYSAFLRLIGEEGREIFNTWTWPKKEGENGEPTDEDHITVEGLFEKFEDYWIPRRNLIVERRMFFQKNHGPTKPLDSYVTELRNLAKKCEFGEVHDGLMTPRIVEGIRSDKVRDRLLRLSPEITLQKALDICRADEVTRQQMKSITEKKIRNWQCDEKSCSLEKNTS